MVKKKYRMDGVVLSSSIIGLVSQKPRTVGGLTNEIFGDKAYNNKAYTGRVYDCIEKLVENKMVVPLIEFNQLKYKLNTKILKN
jgi:hypothetical protein